VSLGLTFGFLVMCLSPDWWMLMTGYRLMK
jgi:hypothetical protein